MKHFHLNAENTNKNIKRVGTRRVFFGKHSYNTLGVDYPTSILVSVFSQIIEIFWDRIQSLIYN